MAVTAQRLSSTMVMESIEIPVLWFRNKRGLWPTESVIRFACLVA
jgi:hypothetical protein